MILCWLRKSILQGNLINPMRWWYHHPGFIHQFKFDILIKSHIGLRFTLQHGHSRAHRPALSLTLRGRSRLGLVCIGKKSAVCFEIRLTLKQTCFLRFRGEIAGKNGQNRLPFDSATEFHHKNGIFGKLKTPRPLSGNTGFVMKFLTITELRPFIWCLLC